MFFVFDAFSSRGMHEVYDTGTELIYEPSFDRNSAQKGPFPIFSTKRYTILDSQVHVFIGCLSPEGD